MILDTKLLRTVRAYRQSWPWATFEGSELALKYAYRDLANLDAVLNHTRHRRGGVAVQAGGSLGLFPKRLAESFDEVHTFEPDPDLFGKLCANVRERNVKKRAVALGFSRDPVALSRRRRDTSGKPEHEGLTHVAGPGDIPQILLDDLHLPRCNLIYLDIEGHELLALRGAAETIRRCRPAIVVEMDQNLGFVGLVPEDLYTWFDAMGYSRIARYRSDELFLPRSN